MNVHAVFGGRLDHQFFEVSRTVDCERAAETLLGQLQCDSHTSFGDAGTTHRNDFPRVHEQRLVSGLIQVMHVLTELRFARVQILGVKLALALSFCHRIKLSGHFVQDTFDAHTHALRIWPFGSTDGKPWVFRVIGDEFANFCTAHKADLFVVLRMMDGLLCFESLE